MSIGEKIAYRRKKANMSQEELGQQLFVTRQTVSQWENDQTVPTVENFMRLCEIFKLTMNDFFEQNVSEAQKDLPEVEERYVFEYTEGDIDKSLFMLTKGQFMVLLCSVAFMIFVIVAGTSSNAVFLAKVYLAVNIFKLVNLVIGYVRERVKIKARLMGEKYVYEVIGGGIYCSVYSTSGELRLYERIDMTYVEKTWNSQELYIFQHKQRRYIIIKEQVPMDSKFKKILGFRL